MHLTRAIITAAGFGAAGLMLIGCQAQMPGKIGAASSQAGPRVAAEAAPPASFADEQALRQMGLREYPPNQLSVIRGDRVQMARLLEDQVVVLTRRNMCYRVDGRSLMAYALADIAPTSSGQFQPPTFDGLHYLFAGRTRAVGVNGTVGGVDVDVRLEFPADTQAVSDREFVYVGGSDGRIFAYAIDSQVAHWDSKYGVSVTSLGLTRGLLIAARSDVSRRGRGVLQAIRPNLWTDVWEQNTEGPITAPIVCTDDAIFVACGDGSIYRFNAERGWEEWRVRTPAPLVDEPIVLADRLVQIVPGAGTWVVRRDRTPEPDGQVMWKDAATLHFLARIQDRMYFLDGENLVCKQADSGKTLASTKIRDAANLIPVANPSGTRLYLVGRTGQVACFTGLDQPYVVVGQ